MLRFDVSVTGAGRERTSPSNAMVIWERDVINAVEMCLAFADGLFRERDPYERHLRFYFNAELRNTGYRSLVKDADNQQTVSVRMSGEKDLKAFDAPRLLSRRDLAEAQKQGRDVVVMLVRRFQQ